MGYLCSFSRLLLAQSSFHALYCIPDLSPCSIASADEKAPSVFVSRSTLLGQDSKCQVERASTSRRLPALGKKARVASTRISDKSWDWLIAAACPAATRRLIAEFCACHRWKIKHYLSSNSTTPRDKNNSGRSDSTCGLITE